jgi:acetolactate synthase I/II/III large subunit
MNGAESLVRTLVASSIDTCFANPGTSEMHFVAALDRVPGIRCILALFEGVATGAADGYARMMKKPAATLLHCGPGLANGLSNLHNARRARVPILNIVGDQATYHRPFDPPLTADTEALARSVSGWTRIARQVETVGVDAATAVQAVRSSYDIGTLILPSDVSWNEGGIPAQPLPVSPPSAVTPAAVSTCARVLRGKEPAAILVAGEALQEEGLATAHRIAVATGAKLFAPTFNRLIQRGQGRYPIALFPYIVDSAVSALEGIRHLILVGCGQPVGFFGYPGKPSLMQPSDSTVHVLARPEEDVMDALRMLASELSAPVASFSPQQLSAPERGPLTPTTLAQTVAALIPEQAIVVDESVSCGFALYPATHAAAPHDWLQVCGGSVGEGPPLATGAAIAAPGRRVINIEGDGSALYMVQALWTQARERLDVTTLICANRHYAILDAELRKVGATPGRTALDLFDLSNPTIDWTTLAGSLGVEAARATSVEQLTDLLTASNRHRGPFLIELVLG